MTAEQAPRTFGRYALHAQIASGGMASVHIGRLLGPVGFARTIAIKRLHPWLVSDPEFVSMFLDEARLAGRIRHPNVVPVLDVVTLDRELLLVMEYVPGESLAALMRTVVRRDLTVPTSIAVAIASGILRGLHAAHEAKDQRGRPLHIVHRDVSPQNVLIAPDGVTRVVDFGVAKAAGRNHHTRAGQVKGKLAYMAPEQIQGRSVDRRADVYAASQVLWEMLTLRTLCDSEEPGVIVHEKLKGDIISPSELSPACPRALAEVVLRGLAHDENDRFSTAREMVAALQGAVKPATDHAVGEWVERTARGTLEERAKRVAVIEGETSARGEWSETVHEVLPVVNDAPTSAHTPDEIPTVASHGRPRRAPRSRPPGARPSATPSAARSPSTRRLFAGGFLGGVGAALALSAVVLIVDGSRESPRTEPRAAQAPSPAAAPTQTPVGAEVVEVSDLPKELIEPAPRRDAARATSAAPKPKEAAPAARPSAIRRASVTKATAPRRTKPPAAVVPAAQPAAPTLPRGDFDGLTRY